MAQKYGNLNMKMLNSIPLNYLEERISGFLTGNQDILLQGQT
jgi:hypothetical protein